MVDFHLILINSFVVGHLYVVNEISSLVVLTQVKLRTHTKASILSVRQLFFLGKLLALNLREVTIWSKQWSMLRLVVQSFG